MVITRINDTNKDLFDSMLFMENHTLGVPVIMVGVIENQTPAGAAAIEIDGEVGRIISIFIKEEYRKQGTGKAMIERFKNLGEALGVKYLEADFVPEEEGVKELLESENFILFRGNSYNYIMLDELVKSPRIKKIIEASKNAPKCTTFKNFADRGKKLVLHNMSIDKGDVDFEEISESLSAAVCDESGSPVGCVIASMEDQDIVIHYLRAIDNDPIYLSALINHLYEKLSPKAGCGLRVSYLEDTMEKTDYVLQITGENADIRTDMEISHAVCNIA